MSDRVHLSLDDESAALLENIEDEIKNLYGSKSAFFQQQLMQYNETSRLKAKKKLLEDRIQHLERRAQELKEQKKGVESKLQEVTVEKEEEEEQEMSKIKDNEFWDKTVKMIATRRTSDEPKKVESRYDKWFESRYSLYCNKFNVEISMPKFKKELLNKMENQGFDDEVEALQ